MKLSKFKSYSRENLRCRSCDVCPTNSNIISGRDKVVDEDDDEDDDEEGEDYLAVQAGEQEADL